MRVNGCATVKKKYLQGRSRSGNGQRLQIMAYQLHGSYKKVDTNAFNSYQASSRGECSPKEQEWRQVFIEARERPFAILWEEFRTILKYVGFES